MRKNRIRLTKSQLNRLVTESVKKTLNEIGDTPKGQYALGALAGRKHNRGAQTMVGYFPGYDTNAEWETEEYADNENGQRRSRYFDMGRNDFDDSTDEKLDDMLAQDGTLFDVWDKEGNQKEDFRDAAMDYFQPYYDGYDGTLKNDLGLQGYDLKGAMAKRGLSESKLNRIIRNNMRRYLH